MILLRNSNPGYGGWTWVLPPTTGEPIVRYRGAHGGCRVDDVAGADAQRAWMKGLSVGKNLRELETQLDQVWYSAERDFACLSFRMEIIVLPIWVTGAVAQRVENRLVRRPNRPDSLDLVYDLIEDTGIDRAVIDGYVDGAFQATLYLKNGKQLDCRPTDALLLADIEEKPLFVRETIALNYGVVVSAKTDIADVFEGNAGLLASDARALDMEQDVDVSNDEQFSAFMNDLGLSENDLRLGFEESDEDTDDD